MNKLLHVLVAGLLLTGCSYVEKLTGQTDDTVLPGQREDAIPGRSQFPDQTVAAQTTAEPAVKSGGEPAATSQPQDAPAPCPADAPDCEPTTADDMFSDGQ